MRRFLFAAALLALVGLIALVRIGVARKDATLSHGPVEGWLRTDPALIAYITSRIIESGGRPPEDFRADSRVEYPHVCDLPAMETVGQEFFVAWSYLASGSRASLHEFASTAMAWWASLAVLGVVGLAYELARKPGLALLAGLLYALLAVNYRSVGIVFLREDFCLPFFALHLYLAARAVRVRTSLSGLGAGLALAAALSTWHAMGFIVLLEVACLVLYFLHTGENPLASLAARTAMLPVVVASLLVPVLRAKLFLASPAMAAALALCLTGWIHREAQQHAWRPRLVFAALGLAFVALGTAAARWLGAEGGDYAHVFELMRAKLAHLGRMPNDPRSLTFGARLLWQGPFKTSDWRVFTLGMPAGVLALAALLQRDFSLWLSPRRALDAPSTRRLALLLGLFGAVSILMTYLVERLQVLPGILTPAFFPLLLLRLRRKTSVALAICIVLAQGFLLYRILLARPIPWYADEGAARIEERAQAMRWISEHVPPGEPIAADFLNSAAILLHTRHPILQQPKYETRQSRERIESFFTAFFQRSPASLAEYLRANDCDHLLIDRPWLGGNLYIGGVPPAGLQPRPYFAPLPGTAAAYFLESDPAVYANIPGFELLYRTTSFRLYRAR